jgi:outer membrane lipoprotein-sorting protein
VTDPRLSSRSRLASLRRAFLALSLIALAGGCTSLPPRQPLPPEVLTARAELEARWEEFRDLRSLTDITIRRSGRTDRLSGVLLLRAPASLRFEALTPFGPPILVVASDAETVTLWEVAQERAYLARATPEATRRWLGLALGSEDLVALLAGYALPPRDPLSGTMVPPDDMGPSVAFETADGRQRIWLDATTGDVRQVEWTGGSQPARAAFVANGVHLSTLDGKLDVTVAYRDPQRNSGFDPALLTLTVPQGVKIVDFR